MRLGCATRPSVALDASNNLFVSDYYLLLAVTEFSAPVMNGETASVVYGQNNSFGSTIATRVARLAPARFATRKK